MTSLQGEYIKEVRRLYPTEKERRELEEVKRKFGIKDSTVVRGQSRPIAEPTERQDKKE